MNIAVRVPNWIGDVVMCLPALETLQNHLPEARITVVCRPHLAALFPNLPYIAAVVSIPDERRPRLFLRARRELAGRDFSAGILFTNSFGSALLFRGAGIRPLYGYERDGRGFLLQHHPGPAPAVGHHAGYYVHLVSAFLGREVQRSGDPRLILSDAERHGALLRLRELDPAAGRWMAVAPGAAYGAAKTWPPQRFSHLLQEWHEHHPADRILILGAAAEHEMGERIRGQADYVFNLAGRLPLRESLALLAQCRLFIGNDSGLMHAAAALRVPVVAVFGPTRPDRTAPLTGQCRILQHKVECAPCIHRRCPGDHRCMNAVGVDEVAAAARSLLEAG